MVARVVFVYLGGVSREQFYHSLAGAYDTNPSFEKTLFPLFSPHVIPDFRTLRIQH